MAAAAGAGDSWSSKVGFLLAAIGCSVGLGNLWRFPYQAGENGGAAFVAIYILCIVLIGLPLLSAEIFLGRRGGGSAVAAIKRVAKIEGQSGAWTALAWIGGFASFFIVTFYSVIAGWVIHFTLTTFSSLIANIGQLGLAGIAAPAFAGEPLEEVRSKFTSLLEQPGKMVLYHGIFVIILGAIVARGISGGIEKSVKVLMPVFFVMLVLLVIFAMIQGDPGTAIAYLFKPDFSALALGVQDGSILTAALGQAFFSVGIGASMMLTYGSYLQKDVNIPGSSVTIVGADTLVALISGLAIFPIVFMFGIEPSGGPGLMFISLPLVFNQMAYGALFGFVFFAMALFAAITSAISMIEVVVAWGEGESPSEGVSKTGSLGRRRVVITALVCLIVFVIGTGNALSQVPNNQPNFFNSWTPLTFITIFEGKTLLDVFDILTSVILMPLSAFLISLFAGWAVSTTASREELGFASESQYRIWSFLVRYLCPFAIGAVFIKGVFF